MDGRCDVPGCEQPTYMGWRPLNEPLGRQVCEGHWLRHKNPDDSFELYTAFGLRRQARISNAGAGFFAAGRKRQPEKDNGVKKPMKKEPEKRSYSNGDRKALGRCRTCGQARQAGHSYCENCSRERRAEKNRQRQKRHYDKVKNLTLLKHKNEGGMTGRNGAK